MHQIAMGPMQLHGVDVEPRRPLRRGDKSLADFCEIIAGSTP